MCLNRRMDRKTSLPLLCTAILLILSNANLTLCKECREDDQCSNPPSELCCSGLCTKWFKCEPPRCTSNEYCTSPGQQCDDTYRCTDKSDSSITFPEICKEDSECLDHEHCDSESGRCLPGRKIDVNKDANDGHFDLSTVIIIGCVTGGFIVLCLVGFFCYRFVQRSSLRRRSRTGASFETNVIHFGNTAEQTVSQRNDISLGDITTSSNPPTTNISVVRTAPPPYYPGETRGSETSIDPPSYNQIVGNAPDEVRLN